MDSPTGPVNPSTPSGSAPEEPEVVWPEDPLADARPAEAEPDPVTPQVTPPAAETWSETFGEPATPHPHQQVGPLADDPQTAPFPTQPAIPIRPEFKTEPPTPRTADEAVKTAPPAPHGVDAAADEAADAEETGEAVKTAPPAPRMDGEHDTKPTKPTAEFHTEPPTPRGDAYKTVPPMPRTQTALPVVPLPSVAAKESPEAVETAPASEAKEAEAPEPSEGEPAPVPVEAEPELVAEDVPAAPERVPALKPELAPEPLVAAAQESTAAPATQPSATAAKPAGSDPLPWPEAPKPANPSVPSWAPRLQHTSSGGSWPAGGTNLPTWAPQTTGHLPRPPAPPQPAAPNPAAPAANPPAPSAPQPATAPGAAHPAPAAAPAADAKGKPAWEIVAQEEEVATAKSGPTPEDKSYAEWFAWAKRSGAPASACHAAAQGAFRALAAGQDMTVAVQWATLAMASPPGLVGNSRQIYCAWFSLGNIDLKLPTQQAHAFATGAIQALDSGADSMVAHQAGLAAAGITAR